MTPVPECKQPQVAAKVWKNHLSTGLIALLLLCAYAAVLYNWNGQGNTGAMVVFTSPLINVLMFLIALLLPVAASLFIIWRWRGVVRLVGATMAAVLGLPSVLLVPLTALFGFCGVGLHNDTSFQRLRDLPVGHYHAVVYCTNAGATAAYGITVRQELPLFLGLRLVRNISHTYGASDVELKVLGLDTIRVVPGQYAKPPEAKSIHLEPLSLF
jgi:hypothetical protein